MATSITKRLRNWFFQSTVEKSPRGNSVRFGTNHDPNENSFRNWAASFVNFLEDFATETVAGIFVRASTTEVQNRTRTSTIDGVAYPNAVDPDQLPSVIGGDGITVSSAMNGNFREYTVNNGVYNERAGDGTTQVGSFVIPTTTTYFINGGTYTGNLSLPGTAAEGKPIMVVNLSDNTVTLSAGGSNSFNSTAAATRTLAFGKAIYCIHVDSLVVDIAGPSTTTLTDVWVDIDLN